MFRGGTTVPDEDRAELPHQPPPALPDGSLPVYPAHPLPGMPGGSPRLPDFGWGLEFADDGELVADHSEPSRRRRITLVASLLVICGAALAVLIVVIATRSDDSAGVRSVGGGVRPGLGPGLQRHRAVRFTGDIVQVVGHHRAAPAVQQPVVAVGDQIMAVSLPGGRAEGALDLQSVGEVGTATQADRHCAGNPLRGDAGDIHYSMAVDLSEQVSHSPSPGKDAVCILVPAA
jgi:hypothetical protein